MQAQSASFFSFFFLIFFIRHMVFISVLFVTLCLCCIIIFLLKVNESIFHFRRSIFLWFRIVRAPLNDLCLAQSETSKQIGLHEDAPAVESNVRWYFIYC